MHPEGQAAVVTGVSSGIGLAIAKQLVQKGVQVFGRSDLRRTVSVTTA